MIVINVFRMKYHDPNDESKRLQLSYKFWCTKLAGSLGYCFHKLLFSTFLTQYLFFLFKHNECNNTTLLFIFGDGTEPIIYTYNHCMHLPACLAQFPSTNFRRYSGMNWDYLP